MLFGEEKNRGKTKKEWVLARMVNYLWCPHRSTPVSALMCCNNLTTKNPKQTKDNHSRLKFVSWYNYDLNGCDALPNNVGCICKLYAQQLIHWHITQITHMSSTASQRIISSSISPDHQDYKSPAYILEVMRLSIIKYQRNNFLHTTVCMMYLMYDTILYSFHPH